MQFREIPYRNHYSRFKALIRAFVVCFILSHSSFFHQIAEANNSLPNSHETCGDWLGATPLHKWMAVNAGVPLVQRDFHTLLVSIKTSKVHKEFMGMNGLLLVAKNINPTNVEYVFQIVSDQLSETEFDQLQWGRFLGSAIDLENWKNYLTDINGKIKPSYKDQKGYSDFADQYTSGKMLKAFTNTSSVLSESEFAELGWKSFQGTTEEF